MRTAGRTQHSKRGIAIIIVMVCIFVLAALAAIFAAYMKVEVRLAANSNNEEEMQWLGRSGVEKARWILGQQLVVPNEPYDSLNQKWAGGDCETNEVLADATLKDNALGHGKFSITITDTERKFNINLALGNDAVLQQAMILIGVDAAEIPTIIASVQDWIDRDDTMHVNGAESEYYQSLNPPYFAKNGPIDDLTELLFVKGVTPEIYWGPNSTNHPMQVFQTKSPLRTGVLPNQAIATAGLVDIFTPISSGRINLNTASATTLQMIPGLDANMAAAIIRMRSGPDGIDGTCDDVPLRQPGGQDLINIGLSAQAAQALTQYCDVRSSTFEVQVDVEVGVSKRRYYALLKRNSPKDVQILSFRWE
jgi:general secretion pathway protein K